MGLCGSGMTEAERQEFERSKMLEQQNREDHLVEQEKIKLLLLGAGESGKSTIFKQMKLIYGEKYSDEDLKAITPVVYNNSITSMKVLIEQCKSLSLWDQCKVQDIGDAFMLVNDDKAIDDKIGDMIIALWKDPGITATYKRKSEFQLNDSAKYYFKKMDIIKEDGYVATTEDLLRSRVRTSGIVEEVYTIDEVVFVMYDVGGQRNERKKWIHCFDSVTAVIFVAAISEYDQVLYEDADTNRMEEALNLFDEICNSRWFVETSMILFLNKKDLFEEKIKTVDPKEWFADYDGGCDYEAAKNYFTNCFLKLNKSESKEIYHHVTCATDTANVKVVFNSCKDIILKSNLKGSGFMD